MIDANLITVMYVDLYVELLLFLIMFPLIPALILTVLRNENLRGIVVTAGAGICALGSILLLALPVGQNQLFFTVPAPGIALVMLVLEILIAGYLVMVSVKAKQFLVTGFVLFQLLLIGGAEWLGLEGHAKVPDLLTDEFSAIMAVIIGVIGGLICIYALGYMREYHEHHKDLPDKRPKFFAILFLFLSAMFGVVFSNNLIWMYFFWEVTTLCSYLLIRYPENGEAVTNAFRALLYNLIGGACFPIAILYILMNGGSEHLGIGSLIAAGPAIALVPACLIAIAGCAKSAQLPFSSWLVGAMVAPTPVSALLHSSTMVKAGVYAIARFAPVFDGQILGMVIALIGGVTFLVTSCIAISQSNAKKVLAYSTIANLGLIVACAGVGTPEALWAAIFLIIFHAISKSLLFLSVGTVEHRIGSRDIEDMTGLAASMPKVSLMMLIGIAGMFLAPFGMLISKWASIHAFSQALPPFGMILIVILAYGSAVTVFFWAKWMGKLLEVRKWEESIEFQISRAEWAALIPLTALTIIACFGIAPISTYFIEPFLVMTYGPISELIPASNLMIMLLMLALIVVLPVLMIKILIPKRNLRRYMGGVTVHDGLMEGSAGAKREISLSNLYLEDLFPEARLSKYGSLITIVLFCVLLIGLISGGVL
ncbi:MAG TPA: proton-conducting transporter membrane subunit [Methanospirillum sp.]|uniref:NADH-quinone oxidoreductase subunit 5 family protein n=1 Tax=Methanospirillum sp. TaxID=45200 RepID=UPI002CAA102B|nr:proton-conducting transporter membrane subunit [Methanospirillum sp.]HWQ62950.1 proton-conducting transporter membrane subunit [Methanospirillum sp.]